MKLMLAMVFVKNMERMTAFYRDGLGLRVIPEKSTRGWTVFDAEGAQFALHQIPPGIAAGIEIREPPEERSNTPIKLIFETAEMDAVCARIQASGAKVLEARNSGSRDAIDPEGNVFQIKPA